MKIEWKKINNTDRYEVSTDGRIKVLSFIDTLGRNKKERELKCYTTRKGYLQIALYTNDGRKHLSVHRLVAEAFIPNPESKPQVNHKNGIRSDNRVENLEWVTNSENQLHAYKLGRSNPMQKLSNEEVEEIRYLSIIEDVSSKELAFIYKVSRGHINDIISNRTRNNTL